MGRSEILSNELESIVKNDPSLGVIDPKQKIIGTYIHGWLESPEITRRLLALVSPELHNRESEISKVKNIINSTKVDAICTDRPELW